MMILDTMFVFFGCMCGNCIIASLQNISECCCCNELEGCQDLMKSGLVVEDIGADVTLKTNSPKCKHSAARL